MKVEVEVRERRQVIGGVGSTDSRTAGWRVKATLGCT